jgi:hypothetical protein
MTPARLTAIIAAQGEACTLQRSGQTDLSVSAFVRGYRPEQLVGGLQQGDRQVTMTDSEIAAASWPGPPQKGDFVVINSKTTAVQDVESREVGGVTYMHVLTVRG